MKSLTCKKCGKVIEGYSLKHVQFLMMQHELKHRREEKNGNKMEENRK